MMADIKESVKAKLAVLQGGSQVAANAGVTPLGESIWWSLKNIVIGRDELIRLMDKHQLDTAFVPKTLRTRSAVLRTLDGLADDGLLEKIVEHPDYTVFQWSDRNVDQQVKTATYDFKVRFTYHKKSGLLEASEPALQPNIDQLMAYYGTAFMTNDVRAALTNLLYSKHGLAFPLRAEGGFYFVPDSQRDFVNHLSDFIHEVSATSSMGRLAIPATEEAKTQVGKSYVEDFHRELASTRVELAKLKEVDAYRNETVDKKLAALVQMKDQAELYLQMVNIDKKDIEAAAKSVEDEIMAMYKKPQP